MTTIRMTYYPDITQGLPPEDVRDSVLSFANEFSKALAVETDVEFEIEVPAVLSVPEQFDDIVAGASAIALMKPVAYVFAHAIEENIVPACVAHRPIDDVVGTFYFAQIYAHAERKICSMKDLREYGAGKLRIAYGDRFSTSNFLIPAGLLKTESIHPFLFFKQIEFAGGHDLAAEAVYDGRADVGAGHDGVIKMLEDSRPETKGKLVQIGRVNIHSDPVVVNKAALPQGISLENVQVACAAAAKTDIGRDALDKFWGWVKDLSATEHANYKSIEDAIAALGLDAADMLSA